MMKKKLNGSHLPALARSKRCSQPGNMDAYKLVWLTSVLRGHTPAWHPRGQAHSLLSQELVRVILPESTWGTKT